jgi:hypothetical protein
MEPITISYGLMKHQIRSSPLAMQVLGYINHEPLHEQEESINNNQYMNPKTTSSDMNIHTVPHISLPNVRSEKSCQKLNDYHAQIYFILKQSGFLHLQNSGFRWKLHFHGEILAMTLHPYIPFIIGDTEGHDRLCGHYNSRGEGVKQLCRACDCPSHLSGYSKVKYTYRRQNHMKSLVERRQFDSPKAMSQHYLLNGFREVRFSFRNQRGIFGACPGEPLHLIQIGWIKYIMESFDVTSRCEPIKGNR